MLSILSCNWVIKFKFKLVIIFLKIFKKFNLQFYEVEGWKTWKEFFTFPL